MHSIKRTISPENMNRYRVGSSDQIDVNLRSLKDSELHVSQHKRQSSFLKRHLQPQASITQFLNGNMLDGRAVLSRSRQPSFFDNVPQTTERLEEIPCDPFMKQDISNPLNMPSWPNLSISSQIVTRCRSKSRPNAECEQHKPSHDQVSTQKSKIKASADRRQQKVDQKKAKKTSKVAASN